MEIERNLCGIFFDSIKSGEDPKIEFLEGIRGCGKSVLLKQLAEKIKDEIENANVIFVDKNLAEFSGVKDAETLYSFIISRLSDGMENFLFIDGIGKIDDYEFVLRRLFLARACRIFACGIELKAELKENAEYILPITRKRLVTAFSYKEFLESINLSDTDYNFSEYLNFATLPILSKFPQNADSSQLKGEFVKNFFFRVLFEDLVRLENIRDANFLLNVCSFLSENVGNTVSATKIREHFVELGFDYSKSSVISYLNALENAFVVYKIQRFDILKNRTLASGEKYYFSVPPTPIFEFSESALKKNAVCSLLISICGSPRQVFAGKFRDFEMDFVVFQEDEPVFIKFFEDENDISLLSSVGGGKKYLVHSSDLPVLENFPEDISIMPIRDFLKLEKL